MGKGAFRIINRHGLPLSSSTNFQESTITVTAPEPTAATRTPPAAISLAVFKPRLLGIADRAGQGVDGAMGQFGDQDQGGTDHDQAPSALIDAQERGRDHDQRAAIAVGEEARVAADRRLDPAPARRHLAARVAPASLGGRVRRDVEIERMLIVVGNRLQLMGRLGIERGEASPVSRGRLSSFMVIDPSLLMSGHCVGANRVSTVLPVVPEPIPGPRRGTI